MLNIHYFDILEFGHKEIVSTLKNIVCNAIAIEKYRWFKQLLFYCSSSAVLPEAK